MKFRNFTRRVAHTAGYGIIKGWRLAKAYRFIFEKTLLEDRQVVIPGIGTFNLIKVQARKRYLPHRGIITSPKHWKLQYKPSRELKNKIRKIKI